MAEYEQYIGGNTTLKVIDYGNLIEFWVRTGTQTWNNEQAWSTHVNGGDSPVLYYRMLRGGFWQKFGEDYVGYDQDVRFTIYDSGLGFPTYDFVVHISRSTVPGPPSMDETYAISSTHIHVEFNSGYTGGSPVLEWQLGYGADSNYPQYFVSSGGTSDVGPFSSGERVYFWARGRNAIGWGDWSSRSEATTWKVPAAPQPIGFEDIQQTSVMTLFYDRGNGGTDILERQLGYGLVADAPTLFASVPSWGRTLITGLSPGQTYYCWGRSRNSVGWGPWSDVRSVILIAGARVLVGAVWKRAVPYVRDGGVWKVAQPFVKNAGVWKKAGN